MKKFFIRLVLLISVLGLTAVTLFLIYVYPFMTAMKKVTTIKYDPQLTLMLGGGGNSGILVSDSVVLLIDTKMNEAADSLYKTVKELAGNRPVIVVNTHIHKDHTGGNKFYEGQTIIAGGNYDKAFWIKECGEKGLPTVWLKDSLMLKIGDETVTILNLSWNAHTQSDVFVYLQNRKMLFGGDVILNRQAPAMFSRYKANGYGYLRAFEYLPRQFEISTVVPGHGEAGGIEVINDFKDFFTDMKVASLDQAREKELLAKYKDWNQIPFIMSPGATEKFFKDNKVVPNFTGLMINH
jgi:glyoxylase-like metal-dependent hydrolase (beta-lactamase superfamily II)